MGAIWRGSHHFPYEKKKKPQAKQCIRPSSASAGPTSVMSSPYFSREECRHAAAHIRWKAAGHIIDTDQKAPGNSVIRCSSLVYFWTHIKLWNNPGLVDPSPLYIRSVCFASHLQNGPKISSYKWSYELCHPYKWSKIHGQLGVQPWL